MPAIIKGKLQHIQPTNTVCLISSCYSLNDQLKTVTIICHCTIHDSLQLQNCCVSALLVKNSWLHHIYSFDARSVSICALSTVVLFYQFCLHLSDSGSI